MLHNMLIRNTEKFLVDESPKLDKADTLSRRNLLIPTRGKLINIPTNTRKDIPNSKQKIIKEKVKTVTCL